MPPPPDRGAGSRGGAWSRRAAELWRDGTALVLLARAYAGFAARRRAGLACPLCAHAGARAVTGDRRRRAGPHPGTCGLGCYAHLEALDYRVEALNPQEAAARRLPPPHPATVEAVCRRLLARAAALDREDAARRGPRPVRRPAAAPVGDGATRPHGTARAGARAFAGEAVAVGGRPAEGARRGAPEEVS